LNSFFSKVDQARSSNR